ncbi:hypothetical protein QJS10_CPB04g01542 [Acorus calamus]|uniref:Uncharacterized protein n=1 Tax=Acorus calamus TaxID=4465 RepID=A0AAV9EZZ9_ACOCL|nr:hypothetical protein QJS10_CPB04g01542 [Acorus calamus]
MGVWAGNDVVTQSKEKEEEERTDIDNVLQSPPYNNQCIFATYKLLPIRETVLVRKLVMAHVVTPQNSWHVKGTRARHVWVQVRNGLRTCQDERDAHVARRHVGMAGTDPSHTRRHDREA